MGYRAAVIALAFAACVGATAGCVRSNAQQCGDLTCPVGRACARGKCVDETIVTACAQLAEGASCMVAEIGTGSCQGGVCRVGACGDGVVDEFESCDGMNLAGKTCLDFGSTGDKGLKCNADCSFDLSGCTQVCGDGVKNTAEQCDGKDFGKQTCITQGFYTGDLTCTTDCKINTANCSGKCGDGVRNGFEQCDGTDFGTDSCTARGFIGDANALSPMLCNAACGLDNTSCTCGGELCPNPTKQKCVLVGNIPTCVNR